jgi:hypothetical protein
MMRGAHRRPSRHTRIRARARRCRSLDYQADAFSSASSRSSVAPKEKGEAMPLITCPDCSAEVSDAAPACPKCGRPMVAAPVAPKGRVEAKTVHAGIGVLVQLVGAVFLLPAMLWIAWVLFGSALGANALGTMMVLPGLPGLIIGGFLISWGGRLATRYLCDVCGHQLTGVEVKICPACKADLS